MARNEPNQDGPDKTNFMAHPDFTNTAALSMADSDYGSTINGVTRGLSYDSAVAGGNYWPASLQTQLSEPTPVPIPASDVENEAQSRKQLWSARLRRTRTNARKRCIRSVKRSCCTRKAWLDRLPILKWLPKYSKRDATGDLVAGITVGLTVVPQSLAYAAIAGLPIQYGLYSSFIGCFVYCILGTSKDVAMGTAALTSLLTASVITKLQPFDPQYAVCVCFLVGCLQLLLGVLKLGILIDFVSIPVLKGFVCSGALIIAAEQIKNLFGTKAERGPFYMTIYEAFAHVKHANIYDVIMSGICFTVLIALKRFTWSLVCRVFCIRMPQKAADGSVPADQMKKRRYLKILRFTVRIISLCRNAFVVVLASVAAYIMLSHNINVVTLSEKIPPGLPPFRPPPFVFPETNRTAVDLIEASGSGIGILALLSLLINVSVGKALGARNGYYIDPTQEFLAVGIGNILSSFVGSYPISTSFSRASLNSECGVRTPAAGILTGGLVILALSFLSPYFAYIPKAALGAVIVCAVLPLFESDVFMHTWRVNKVDMVPLLATMLSAFLLGSEYGILIGVAVSLVLVLYANARPEIDVSTNSAAPLVVNKSSYTGAAPPHSQIYPKPSGNFSVEMYRSTAVGINIITPYGLLYFPTADYIRDLLNEQHLPTKRALAAAAATSQQKAVIINALHISHCDYTSICAVRDALNALARRKIQVAFVSLRKKTAKKLAAAGITVDKFPIYKSLDEATSALTLQAQKEAEVSLPTPVKLSVRRLSLASRDIVVPGPNPAQEDDEIGAADSESVAEFVPSDTHTYATSAVNPSYLASADSDDSDGDSENGFSHDLPGRDRASTTVFVVPVEEPSFDTNLQKRTFFSNAGYNKD